MKKIRNYKLTSYTSRRKSVVSGQNALYFAGGNIPVCVSKAYKFDVYLHNINLTFICSSDTLCAFRVNSKFGVLKGEGCLLGSTERTVTGRPFP